MVIISGIIGIDYSLVQLVAAVKADTSPILKVQINSPGGFVDVGIAMYNYLRGLGRPVHTIAVGECSSIATVVFMAGAKRFAGCDLMIHNPFVDPFGQPLESRDLLEAAEYLDGLKNEIVKIYVGACGIDKSTLAQFMDDSTFISPLEAVGLGLATDIYGHKAVAMFRRTTQVKTQAKKGNIARNINTKKMAKQPVRPAKGKTADLLARARALQEKYARAFALSLTDVAGQQFTVDRDAGDPQVGDAASPDGEYTMEDGKVITVSGGEITEIREPDEETPEELLEIIEELRTELETANTARDEALALCTELTEELDTVLPELEMLRGKASRQGNYTPPARTPATKTPRNGDKDDPVAVNLAALEERKEARRSRYKPMKQ